MGHGRGVYRDSSSKHSTTLDKIKNLRSDSLTRAVDTLSAQAASLIATGGPFQASLDGTILDVNSRSGEGGVGRRCPLAVDRE